MVGSPRSALAALAAASILSLGLASPAAAAPQKLRPYGVAQKAKIPGCKRSSASIKVGGWCGWRATLRFRVDAPVASAVLRLRRQLGRRVRVTVHANGRAIGSMPSQGGHRSWAQRRSCGRSNGSV